VQFLTYPLAKKNKLLLTIKIYVNTMIVAIPA